MDKKIPEKKLVMTNFDEDDDGNVEKIDYKSLITKIDNRVKTKVELNEVTKGCYRYQRTRIYRLRFKNRITKRNLRKKLRKAKSSTGGSYSNRPYWKGCYS